MSITTDIRVVLIAECLMNYHEAVFFLKTALEVLFKDEDQALLKTVKINVTEKTKKEVQVYQSFPAVLSSADPIRWWRQKRDQCWPASLCPGLFYDLRAGKNPVGH